MTCHRFSPSRLVAMFSKSSDKSLSVKAVTSHRTPYQEKNGRGRIPPLGPVARALCFAKNVLTSNLPTSQIVGLLSLHFLYKKWRTRQGPIRTESLLPCRIKIPLNETVPIYQKLANKIKELKALGMSNEEIAAKLQINRKTVGKSLAFETKGL